MLSEISRFKHCQVEYYLSWTILLYLATPLAGKILHFLTRMGCIRRKCLFLILSCFMGHISAASRLQWQSIKMVVRKQCSNNLSCSLQGFLLWQYARFPCFVWCAWDSIQASSMLSYRTTIPTLFQTVFW